MATVNTKIQNLTITDGVLTAKLVSTNAASPNFEVKLDGWEKWKPASADLRLGPLETGDRTLEARSYSKRGVVDSTPAVARFSIAAPPPPPPPPPPELAPEIPAGMRLVKKLARTEDWNSVLDTAPGSVIENVTKDGRPAIRLYQPREGERTEVQVHRPEDGGLESNEGIEAYYFWWLFITGQSRLYDDPATICQFHGNNNAGYTGGIVIGEPRPPEELVLRVKGGTQTSAAGSHRYTYESDRGDHAVPQAQMTTEPFKRDVWNLLEYKVKWTVAPTGYALLRLNGSEWVGIEDNYATASNIADVQMTRVGWYPGTGTPIAAPGLEMFVSDFSVYRK